MYICSCNEQLNINFKNKTNMEFLSNYIYPFSVLGLSKEVDLYIEKSKRNQNVEIYKKIVSVIDLTSLNSTDNKGVIDKMCAKVNEFKKHYEAIPNVAAICVYPNFVAFVKNQLKVPDVNIASVSAGFPAAQTFIDVKELETKMAIEGGADEIDIVLSIGKFLSGDYESVSKEITAIKNVMQGKHLKVILETGALTDPLKIWEASLVAMNAGADFIKTSTGKLKPAATVDAAVVMCEAIKHFYKKTGKKIGFKAAGGISTSKDAAIYYTVVEEILGEEWLNSSLFRIGASSLLNNLLENINS